MHRFYCEGTFSPKNINFAKVVDVNIYQHITFNQLICRDWGGVVH